MTTEAAELGFGIEPSPDTNDDQVRIVVDGRDLLATIGFPRLGIDPPVFFAQVALREGGDLLIGRCDGCGYIGCDDLYVSVEVDDHAVVWRDRRGVSYRFDRERYLQAVAEAASSTDWESVSRRAERLVSQIDYAVIEQTGYRFEWASARIGYGRIVLSFDCEGAQRRFDVGWDGCDPEDAARNVRRWIVEFRP